MHARRSLIALGLALVSTAALAQVPGMGAGLIGFGTRGYSAWNPNDAGNKWTFSNGNKTASATASSGYQIVRGTSSHSSGKYYFEVRPTAISNGGVEIGIATSAATLGDWLGNDLYGYGYGSDGSIYHDSNGASYGGTYTNTATIGIAVDFTNLKIYFSINGTWQNSADPAAGTGGSTISAGSYYAAADIDAISSTTATHVINTGASAFSYTIPSGFSAWH